MLIKHFLKETHHNDHIMAICNKGHDRVLQNGKSSPDHREVRPSQGRGHVNSIPLVLIRTKVPSILSMIRERQGHGLVFYKGTELYLIRRNSEMMQ